ncbi:FkbM family methyltransferase [Schlesneria paludicola]|uniref:FkbM family methyltransferase n=1 Tax=Schlesneria paludicola TaxID=360056 RepID=UPI00029A9936|nr:FkbM family methyltransferase [Schlesneria paludicola]
MLLAIKHFAYACAFPVYSLFSRRIPFCAFYPTLSGWRVWMRGRTIDVVAPRVWVLEYFRHFMPKRGDTIFDVGGELGWETKQFSDLVGKSGKVYVFECLPEHLAGLRKIAEQRSNIEIIDRACWDQETELTFFIGHTPGSNTAVPDARGQRGQALADESKQTLVVRAETLDAMWKRLGQKRVNFLKMDIEGAELEALVGAKELLDHVDYAVIAAYHIRDGVRTAERVATTLKAAGMHVRTDENHHVYASRTPFPGAN